jgi:hypothetical protein
MCSTTNLNNYKISTSFILDICSSDVVVITVFANLYIFSTDIDFVNNITITLSNKEMTHNKNSTSLRNFIVKSFFNLN